MGRETSRKILRSSNAAHLLGKRNKAGTLQTTTTKTSLTGVGNTAKTVTLTLTDPANVLFTSATAKLTGLGATNGGTVTLSRNGAAVATTSNTTGGAATTSTTSNTHTTPLVGPQYKAKAKGTDASATGTLKLTLKRDDQWV